VPIVFVNAGGIIFYSDAVDCAEDVIAIASIAAARRFLASAAGRMSLSVVEALGGRIPALARLRVSGDSARMDSQFSTGGLFAAMGFL
jgi:hypothetical protein